MSELDKATIRSYLLRRLPDQDRSVLEEAYFSDDSLLDRVEAEEDQLVSDYVLGRLSEGDRRRFEESLLGSPYYKDRVETTTRLHRRIAKDPALRQLSVSARHRVEAGQLFPGRTGYVVAIAALSVLLVASFVSALRLKDQLAAAQSQASAPTLPSPEPRAAEPAMITLVLDDTGPVGPSLRKVVRPPGAWMLLILPRRLFPPGSTSCSVSFHAVPGGPPLWDSGQRAVPEATESGDVAIRIPPGVPVPGTYSVEVRVGGTSLGAYAILLSEAAEPAAR